MILMTTKNTHIKLKIYKDTKTHANCLEFKQATTAMVAKGQHHCRYTDLSVVFARWRQRAPNPIHGFLGPRVCTPPKQHLDRFSCFCRAYLSAQHKNGSQKMLHRQQCCGLWCCLKRPKNSQKSKPTVICKNCSCVSGCGLCTTVVHTTH